MSTFAVECPEERFFVHATGWTDAFIQTCKLRGRKYGAESTNSREVRIEEVKRFRTIYGEWLDFDKHAITTQSGNEFPIDSNDYFKDRIERRYEAIMEYKGKTYPQDIVMIIE